MNIMRIPRRFAARWLTTMALFCLSAGAHAELQASLQRTHIHLGETTTLSLRTEGHALSGEPDLSALQQDFVILGTANSSNINIVNGSTAASFSYDIVLQPRHAGTLSVPSLSLGSDRSQPLQLTVDPAAQSPTAAADDNKDVFLDVSIDTRHAYVGQQLFYTAKLYFRGNLTDGSLDDPQLPGLDVRRLGDNTQYQAQRNGTLYNVVERHYALIPQHAGQLVIPPLGFQGTAVDLSDPNSFFGSNAAISVHSAAVPIEVDAVPANASQGVWLPARKLSLSLDGSPGQVPLAQGKPLTLTMNLQAVGVPAETLPALSLPPIDGATVYPDKPNSTTRVDGQWLVGGRQQSFTIVPNRAGTLRIPPTTLHWFDVTTGKPQVAQIDAMHFTVAGAAGVPAQASSSNAPASAAQAAATAAANPNHPQAQPVTSTPWRWIALGSLAVCFLLLAIVIYLWRRPRLGPPSAAPSSFRQADSSPPGRAAQAAFVQAAAGGDAARQAQTLLAWARCERPGLHNLGELAAALASDAQQSAIADLQRRQFAGSGIPVPPVDLAKVFAHGFIWRASKNTGANDELPPLYPFKLD